MVMSRHEFLSALHEILRPKVYLEIGVQYGTSLALAVHSEVAIGVDPKPLVNPVDNQVIFAETSQEFFSRPHPAHEARSLVDFGFIDGMHLYEYALQDFINIERHSRMDGSTVVVFDDVLPRNQAEAAREQCPGDWTGDVWRVHQILRSFRPDLGTALVDTYPTGTLLVRGLDPGNDTLPAMWKTIEALYPLEDEEVPEDVINRTHALSPGWVLSQVKEWVENENSRHGR